MWNMRFGELLLFNTTSDCLETAWVSSWGSGLSIWIEIVLWKQGFSFWKPSKITDRRRGIWDLESFYYVIQHQIVLKLLQIKSNHFYCHITTAQVPWWVKFLWACSRQCKKTTNNLHMDRQCKKNNKQFTYGQTVQKKKIYIWTDSAKNCTGAFTVLQTVQKNNSNLHMGRQCKKTTNNLHMGRQCKKTTNNLHMDRQCKKATAIYIWTVHIYRLYRRQCAKYTYIYSVHLVYYKDILNYQRHIIHRMGTSTLCTVSIHNVV